MRRFLFTAEDAENAEGEGEGKVFFPPLLSSAARWEER
jgi:hypothetical protein